MRGLMNKNRMRGGHGGTSEPRIAKSILLEAMDVHPAVVRRRLSILPREACAVSLTKACHDPGTDECGNRVTAAQESADGIVGDGNEPGSLEHELWAAKSGGLTSLKA